jgi:hypothetical protein
LEKDLGKESEETSNQYQNKDKEANETFNQQTNFNRDNQDEDNQENDNAEENFIEEEEPKLKIETHSKTEIPKTTENKEVIHKHEVSEHLHEQAHKAQIHNNNLQISSNNNNQVEAESQNQKHHHDVSNSSFNIQNENSFSQNQQNKKNYITNSFNEVVSANVQNFSFIGTNTSSNKSSSNVVSSNANLNLPSSTNPNVHNSNNYSASSKQTQQQYSTSPQINVNNPNVNKNENKFNLPNFNQAQQNIPNLNTNSNQDLYNAYQMQMSSFLAQNMPSALGQQQVYPMPFVYYPPNGAAGNTAADPSMNYSNMMPYMGYPMGYYMPQQQFPQQPQQNNLKEANDLQNKNRKMNTYVIIF